MRHRRNMDDGADSGRLSPAPLKCQGLADEDATESSQSSHPAGGVVGGAAVKAQQPDAMLQGTGSGRIGAFYPSSDDEEPKASAKAPLC